MPEIGVCKLCLKKKELQLSHAVGDAIFKKIFRENSGKAIEITADNKNIAYSSDSWAEIQLCKDCEGLLNINYERYALSVLRGGNLAGKVIKTELGITFLDVNLSCMRMYFISVFWRAANSNHPSYKNLSISSYDNEYLRNAIHQNSGVPISRFSVKISRFIDRTESGGFSAQDLKEIVISPFERTYSYQKKQYTSVCFVFEGFLIEIFTEGLKLKDRNMSGVIHRIGSVLLIPYIDIFSVKEIFDLMLIGYGKHIGGNSRVKTK